MDNPTNLPSQQTISYDTFASVDIRSGTIVKAEVFERTKKPAFKVWADFGPEIGILQTSAQITHHYKIENLPGTQIFGCINLGPKNIAGFTSQFLLLGFPDQNSHICLTSPLHKVPNGQKLC